MDLKENGWGGARNSNLCSSVLDAMRNLQSQSAGKCDAMQCVDSAIT